MRYIRTKDNIKGYDESCDLHYIYQCIGGIKVADTIEELCDWFIVEGDSNEITYQDRKSVV